MTALPLPRVSVGLPVYNGEKYLGQAIECVLRQTYRDLELVICDNASTDRTQEICQSYAATDPRVRYTRNATNIGLAPNHNRVAELARGEFFLWAAHDDYLAPNYLEHCLTVLDESPNVVLCYALSQDVDENGRHLSVDNPHRERAVSVERLATAAPEPNARFRDLIRLDHHCEAMLGLMRASVLKGTGLHGNYADADRVLLAELGLRGQFHLLKDRLIYHREHSGRSVHIHGNRYDRTVWMDPSNAGKLLLPYFHELLCFRGAVNHAPISSGQAARCYAHLFVWVGRYRRQLLGDLQYALRQRAKRILRGFGLLRAQI